MSYRSPVVQYHRIALRMCSAIAVAAVAMLLAPAAAHAVIVQSGAANNTPPTPAANDPGFANIGKSSTGGASVTYLGNRWILTANHVTIDNSLGPIQFGAFNSNIIVGSKVQLLNGDSSGADLALYRLVSDPGLPSIYQSITATTPAVGTAVTMIGNGRTRGTPLGDGSGYNVDLSGQNIRWGTNNVSSTGQFESVGFGTSHAYHTQFNDLGPTSNEAQDSRGDSGGGVFVFSGGTWHLSGIMYENFVFGSQPNTGSPNFEPTTVVFGNESGIADLSFYRSQILAVVPEPSSVALGVIGLAGLLAFGWRRRQS